YLLEHNIRTRGEFYMADAFQRMMDEGAYFISEPVEVWEDCGQPETLLHTNRYLLDHGHAHMPPTAKGLLIPPVYVADTAVIENAIVGPYASIGEGVVIREALVRDTIVEAGALIERTLIEHSLIGRDARIQGTMRTLNIGDDDVLTL
ncbi:MAG: nucleotidyltransferase, partial [Chloroflexi bacterium]|nr:nucleotidyltransferase [Chloroflexota bacterium]